MQATAKALPILSIFEGLCRVYGKRYCYPSQVKILDLLAERLDMFISIATLNRYLRVIEDSGLIKRSRRITYHPVKGLMFRSTLYVIRGKGLKLLAKYGLAVYTKIKGLVDSSRGESKKAAQDPEPASLPPGGKSYRQYLKNGGKGPSITK